MSIELLKEAVDEGFTPLEYRACEIGETYSKIRREYFPEEPYTALNRKRDKRESRNFAYFYKLAEVENRNRDLVPDISIYLRAQFEMQGLKMGPKENWVPLAPHCLVSNQAWDRYREYVSRLQLKETKRPSSNTSARKVKRSLGQTALFLQKTYMSIFDSTEIDWDQFYFYRKEGDYMPLFFLFVQNQMVSKYFLCASRTYNRWVASLDPDFQQELPQDLDRYYMLLRTMPKVRTYGREAFGREFSL